MLPPPFSTEPSGAAPIRLMIVDDSLVARTVMERILGRRDEFEIVASTSHARHALELLGRVAVDIILLDVEMPGLDGLAALPEMLARSDGARVLMVSASTADGAEATVQALTQGAADTLLKPAAADFAGSFATMLVERLLRIGHAPPRVAGSEARPAGPKLRVASGTGAPPACIAFGASTGGPHAFASLFRALPETVTAPILVTQHLPATFMPHFARQLAVLSGRHARVGLDGLPLRAGEIIVAPGEGHMRIVRTAGELHVRIDATPAASGCMPSVDPMLASLAESVGAGTLAVILSGMGRDGLIGAGMIAARGEILVQDAATSVIWGMPGVVAKAGLACAILPPEAIARRLAERCTVRGAVAWN